MASDNNNGGDDWAVADLSTVNSTIIIMTASAKKRTWPVLFWVAVLERDPDPFLARKSMAGC